MRPAALIHAVVLVVVLEALGLPVLGGPMRAAAQASPTTSVAEGAALYAEADFERAIERLEQALANESLTPADVELALDRIAAAQLALGARTLDRTLARLVLVAPDHRFGADVPAALSQRFARVAPTVRPIELSIASAPLPSGAEQITASIGEDPLSVVRAVELSCGGASELGVTPSLDVAAGTRCQALARGPGGVVLARATHAGARIAEVQGPGAGTTEAGGESLDGLWIGLGIGAGVLVLGAVIVGVAVASSGGSSDVTVVGPMITFGP